MGEKTQPIVVAEDCIDEKILADYRSLLNKLAHESQTDFDKGVLALSGGALGLSFAFTKDVVGPENIIFSGFLLSAWIGWGLSSAAILLSYFFSTSALRQAIRQVDAGTLESPGGWRNSVTKYLNLGGLLLFLAGLAMMIIFLGHNVDRRVSIKSPSSAGFTSQSPSKTQ